MLEATEHVMLSPDTATTAFHKLLSQTLHRPPSHPVVVDCSAHQSQGGSALQLVLLLRCTTITARERTSACAIVAVHNNHKAGKRESNSAGAIQLVLFSFTLQLTCTPAQAGEACTPAMLLHVQLSSMLFSSMLLAVAI